MPLTAPQRNAGNICTHGVLVNLDQDAAPALCELFVSDICPA